VCLSVCVCVEIQHSTMCEEGVRLTAVNVIEN